MESRRENALKFHRECVIFPEYRLKHGNKTDIGVTMIDKSTIYFCIARYYLTKCRNVESLCIHGWLSKELRVHEVQPDVK